MHELFSQLTCDELARVVVRLGAALVFGACIGWDREHKKRAAGLRTHVLVALGSAGATGAIGVAVGAGWLILGAVLALLTVTVLTTLRKLEP
jgi:uncharacterized membrane protein YhiD involved in acid resistance